MSYDHFKSEAKKIRQLHYKYKNMLTKHNEIKEQKLLFIGHNAENNSKLFFYGFMCIAALVFDLIINAQTFSWFPTVVWEHCPAIVVSGIFMIFDMVLAINISGNLEKTLIEKDKSKNRARVILWALALVKIAFLIIFIDYIKIGSIDGSLEISILMTILILIVYGILDHYGAGLNFILTKLKFIFLEEIWYDKPDTIELKIDNMYIKLSNDFGKYNLDYQEFLKIYDLPGKINKMRKED